jgi:hypothetical protein
MDLGPRTAAEISDFVKARKKPVNNLTDLETYFKTADFVGMQAMVYREEENSQELFRVLIAYASLVVETISKHKDFTRDLKKDRRRAELCEAYVAEAMKCIEEMESLKPKINAEALAFKKSRPPEQPKTRPPPVVTDGAAAAKTPEKGTGDALDVRLRSETFAEGDWDLLSATPAQVAAAAERSTGNANAATRGSVASPPRQRYQPKAEYVAAGVSANASAKHSLVGNAFPSVSGSAPNVGGGTRYHSPHPSGPSGYPSVDSTRASPPTVQADTTARPPPPPGPRLWPVSTMRG